MKKQLKIILNESKVHLVIIFDTHIFTVQAKTDFNKPTNINVFGKTKDTSGDENHKFVLLYARLAINQANV